MRTVTMHLDAGFRLGLGVGVTTYVVPSLQQQYSLVQLGGGAFSDRKSEKSGTYDYQVITSEAHSREGSVRPIGCRNRVPSATDRVGFAIVVSDNEASPGA
ncbi:hypothetical protein GCM10027444_33410 [Actinopolyspora lacussalsi]